MTRYTITLKYMSTVEHKLDQTEYIVDGNADDVRAKVKSLAREWPGGTLEWRYIDFRMIFYPHIIAHVELPKGAVRMWLVRETIAAAEFRQSVEAQS